MQNFMSAQTNRLKEFLLTSTSMQAQSTTQKQSKGLPIFVNMQFVHSQQKGLQNVWNATKNAKYEDVKKIVDHFSDEKPIVVIISDQKPQFDLKNFIKQIK